MIPVLLLACAHAPTAPDSLPAVLGALSLAEAVATTQQLATTDPSACVGWGVVRAAAPVVGSAIAQAHLGVAEIPAVALDLSACTGPVQADRVVAIVSAGLASVEALLPLWTAPGDCRARVVAGAALEWAQLAAGSVAGGVLVVGLPAVAVDVGACE